MEQDSKAQREQSFPGIRQGSALSKLGYAASEARWHLICTNGRQERLARAYLKRAGHEVYLPMRLVSGRNRVFGQALFPGYLFVRVHDSAEWRDIFATPGVAGVYSAGDRPASVRKAVVDELLSREDGGFIRLVGDPGGPPLPCQFTAGQRVKVGALEAIFLERVDATRCRLLVSLCGADSKPVTPLTQVEPA
jgi:transcription antitermination factor NusG